MVYIHLIIIGLVACYHTGLATYQEKRKGYIMQVHDTANLSCLLLRARTRNSTCARRFETERNIFYFTKSL